MSWPFCFGWILTRRNRMTDYRFSGLRKNLFGEIISRDSSIRSLVRTMENFSFSFSYMFTNILDLHGEILCVSRISPLIVDNVKFGFRFR